MSGRFDIDWHVVLSRLISVGTKVVVATYVFKWSYEFLIHGSKAIGGDFLVYWWAAHLTRDGAVSVVYEFSKFQESLKTVAGHEFLMAWFYPPTFLLFILPLSVLPYTVSLLSWTCFTFVAYRQVLVRVARHPATTWLTLSFPATFLNISYGQNGFLSAALLGGGLLLLDESPYLAGLLLGLLTYKPQLAILVPVALLAGRQWRALLAFFFTLGSVIMLSSAIFGLGAWVAFWNSLSIAGKVLESGFQGQIQTWQNMISALASARLFGLHPSAARAIQGMVMCAVLLIVTWVWIRKPPLYLKASILTLCVLLFSPYALEYDLTLLALPIAWVSWEGHTKGWMSGEQIILSLAWFAPLLSKLLVKLFNIQLAPIFLIIFLIVVLRRVRKPLSSGACRTSR